MPGPNRPPKSPPEPPQMPPKPIICPNAADELDARLRYFELQTRLRRLERQHRLREAQLPWRLLLRLGWVVVGLWEAYRKWRP